MSATNCPIPGNKHGRTVNQLFDLLQQTCYTNENISTNQMTTSYNSNLNWANDNGIYLPMINDIVRNNFYDRLLSRHVRDQNCVEIGFGTGLLSLIALKHGAKSIVAFEKDSSRYKLGQYVIDQLGLSNKITLVNKIFTGNDFYNFHNTTVFFSEIVDGEIFGEGIWNVFPRSALTKQIFLPNRYRTELWTCEISDIFNLSIDKNVTKFGSVPAFNPGIDVDHNFIKLINKILYETNKNNHSVEQNIILSPIQRGLRKIDPTNATTDWDDQGRKGFMIWKNAIRNTGKVSASYEVDVNSRSISIVDKFNSPGNIHPMDFKKAYYSLTLDMSDYHDKNLLIWPRTIIGDDTEYLYLDTAHSWGSVPPVVATKYSKDITLTHVFGNSIEIL
jgi:hypothetical protein